MENPPKRRIENQFLVGGELSQAIPGFNLSGSPAWAASFEHRQELFGSERVARLPEYSDDV
jgi:hypothetical protein